MRLIDVYKIKSKDKMVKFLNSIPSGTLGTIDEEGFPQLIPMNFVYFDDAIYMHSYHLGEKIDNIKRSNKVGFEAHKHVEFLPSYFFDEEDASQADTLYISIVIKGYAKFVDELDEKARALNALMQKYQKEGRYKPLDASMNSVKGVTVIKIDPITMTGKYKLGQYWSVEYRRYIASRILARTGSKDTIALMGFNDRLEYKHEPDW